MKTGEEKEADRKPCL